MSKKEIRNLVKEEEGKIRSNPINIINETILINNGINNIFEAFINEAEILATRAHNKAKTIFKYRISYRFYLFMVRKRYTSEYEQLIKYKSLYFDGEDFVLSKLFNELDNSVKLTEDLYKRLLYVIYGV